jgi:hypothetical protein
LVLSKKSAVVQVLQLQVCLGLRPSAVNPLFHFSTLSVPLSIFSSCVC